MGTETIDIPVRDVIVKDRIRKDLGNTDSLMISMEKRGQLQPIGIDSQNNLVFGERRLDVATRAGWETIRATRFDTLDDAAAAMAAEFDENTERKEFTPLELLAATERLGAILKPAAVAKRDEKLKRGTEPPKAEVPVVGKLPTTGETREISTKTPAKTRELVAAAFGTSDRTVRKISAVAKAAEKPDASPKVKAAAEEMERTGKVDPAYKVVQEETAPPVDPIEAKRAELVTAAEALERPYRELCDLDRDIDRPGGIELLGKLIAKIRGKKRRLTPKPVDELDQQAEELWKAYPRKVNKGDALKAMGKALLKAKFPDLLSAVKEYAAAVAKWPKADHQYIPHASRWFNGKRWEDDRNDWKSKSAASKSKNAIGPGQTYDPDAAEKDPDHGKF